ncbi:methyltransferase-like protein 25B [Scylla paramamosain]|uniref:methyltransferase-like protein 25B n=1 Tax=Scylla paramamosain TaxID=85552 RepID=UPI0030834578
MEEEEEVVRRNGGEGGGGITAAMQSHQYVHLSAASVQGWRNYTSQAVQLLDLNRNILDSYVLDFFTEDLWSRLNPKWTAVLDKFSPGDLASFLQNGASIKQESAWPLSLLAFLAASHALSLPRKAVSSVNPLLHYLSQQVQTGSIKLNKPEYHEISRNVENKSEIEYRDENYLPDYSTAGQHKLLQHVFRRHLKPKKQHEVARLAIVAAQVARCVCDGVMVDVGLGQGHLSRLLAYGHDVRVVCLEAEDKFIDGARKFDHQLEKAVEKMTRKNTSLPLLPPGPRHAVCHLQPNMDPHTFTKLLLLMFPPVILLVMFFFYHIFSGVHYSITYLGMLAMMSVTRFSWQVITGVWPDLQSRGEVCGLLGLHTCGDLAPTLLRIFTSMPACQAVVSVGCCYMKLTTASEENPGFPMSNFVRCLPGHALSYESREVACHAVEMYTDRLSLGTDNLKVHCYCACLEEILVKHWPHHYHAGLRSVNNANHMDFSTYAKQAVSRLQDVVLPEADLTSEETLHNLTRWQQVVVYYSLRLLLAPVVEAVVLLDRLLFLHDNGLEGILFPAFDPQLSPRIHILVSVKPTNKL